MKVKEESEKVGLKHNIQKMKIMASSPMPSHQIDGETMKTVIDFIFGGSKITGHGGCSYEIRTFAPWKKSYHKCSILKSRDITLLTKVCIVKAMYSWESWIIKKSEWQRIELWCWRRFLIVPWTARRSNQSILKEINSEYSLEGLKLKLKYSAHLIQRVKRP